MKLFNYIERRAAGNTIEIDNDSPEARRHDVTKFYFVITLSLRGRDVPVTASGELTNDILEDKGTSNADVVTLCSNFMDDMKGKDFDSKKEAEDYISIEAKKHFN